MDRQLLECVGERVAGSRRVVALTGAGVSAESGIPTFRDPGGIWERLGPEEAGTGAGFPELMVRKPWQAVELLAGFRAVFASAAPNAGHLALAELERLGHVRSVITQNVDGLHREAGSARVVELHGTLTRRRCLACGRREAITKAELVDELDAIAAKLSSYMVSHPAHILRRCPCGGLMRWDFVAFGEPVQGLEDAVAEASRAEVMIVCGTSGAVYPAASLPERAREAGAFVAEVNPNPTELTDVAHVRLAGTTAALLPALLDAVRRQSAAV